MTSVVTEPGYTIGELMAVAIGRELTAHDGQWIAVGAYSQLPMAAVKLARMTGAPSLWWLCGGSGAINSTSKVVTSTSDYRNLRGAECVMSLEDIVAMEMWRFQRENPRVIAILGGMQIDKHGNSNMVCVGDYDKPQVRGVGTVGLCFGVSFNLMYFYTMHHNRRIFVDTVDFISSPGFTPDRARYVAPEARGPQKLFTPLGVFDFAPDTGTMRIHSLHPGVTLDEVRDRTGFDVVVPPIIERTPAPSEIELHLLRTEIDPDGVINTLRITR